MIAPRWYGQVGLRWGTPDRWNPCIEVTAFHPRSSLTLCGYGYSGHAPPRRESRRTLLPQALEGEWGVPCQLVTEKRHGYVATRWELGLRAIHRTGWYKNNRAEVPHQHNKARERRMCRSSQQRRYGVFSRSMRPHATHLGSHAIVSRRSIIDSFESEPSPLGRPRQVFAERRSGHRFSIEDRFGENNLTIPE